MLKVSGVDGGGGLLGEEVWNFFGCGYELCVLGVGEFLGRGWCGNPIGVFGEFEFALGAEACDWRKEFDRGFHGKVQGSAFQGISYLGPHLHVQFHQKTAFAFGLLHILKSFYVQ